MPAQPGIFVILPPELHSLFRNAAKAAGLPVSRWLRETGADALEGEPAVKARKILEEMAAAKAEVVRANGRKRVPAKGRSTRRRGR